MATQTVNLDPERIADGINERIADCVKPLARRIKALEAEIETLKANGAHHNNEDDPDAYDW